LAQNYTVTKGDTLASIAERTYKDAALAEKLADYNGLRDASRILPGQTLQVPSKRELKGRRMRNLEAAGKLPPPVGLQEIVQAFGDIYSYLHDGVFDSAAWEGDYIVLSTLPFPMILSWDHTQTVRRFRCHKLMVDVFAQVFGEIANQGLQSKLVRFAGCYQQRSQRNSNKISTHTWGIAVDLNSETNGQGTPGDMDPGVVEIFRNAGFKWGGDWPGKQKDAMHFQYCSGY